MPDDNNNSKDTKTVRPMPHNQYPPTNMLQFAQQPPSPCLLPAATHGKGLPPAVFGFTRCCGAGVGASFRFLNVTAVVDTAVDAGSTGMGG